MEHQDTQPTAGGTPKGRSSLPGKLAVLGVSAALFTGAVFGLTGLASAQDPDSSGPAATAEAEDRSDPEAVTVDVDVTGDEDGVVWDVDISPEDEALFEEFEQCLSEHGLSDGGLDEDAFEDQADWDRIDDIFEECEPILDDLTEDFGDAFGEDLELSPEDEALFEEFEQCLTDNGLDEEAIEDGEEADTLTDEDWDRIDDIFEDCEPILDDLSEDGLFFGELEGCDDFDFDEDHDAEDLDHDEADDAETADA